jgi:two-component system, cell cycle sensor histidine kinase and response regulator CckA
MSTVERGDEPTILVVDDHRACREMVARLLGVLGYQVLEAASGAEAKEKLASHRDQLAALIVDLCLEPRGDLDFARHLAIEHPGLPVVFISGYSTEMYEAMVLDGADRQFLQKPFSMTQLEGALDALLANAQPIGGTSRANAA